MKDVCSGSTEMQQLVERAHGLIPIRELPQRFAGEESKAARTTVRSQAPFRGGHRILFAKQVEGLAEQGSESDEWCVLEVSACQSDPSAVLEPVGARRPMSLSLKSGAQGSLPIFHFVRSFRCRKQANQWKIDRRWCQATATIQRPSAGPAITPPAIGWDRIHESMRLRDFRGLSLAAESDPNALLAPAGLEHPVALSLGL